MGPLGVVEVSAFQTSTRALVQHIAALHGSQIANSVKELENQPRTFLLGSTLVEWSNRFVETDDNIPLSEGEGFSFATTETCLITQLLTARTPLACERLSKRAPSLKEKMWMEDVLLEEAKQNDEEGDEDEETDDMED
jgi:hypothetical protein